MTALVSPPAPRDKLLSISAGWRYSSGTGHFAVDYRMPQGTPLYAVRDGVILDCQDGVVDYTPGRPGNRPGQAGPGSPSNWVLLRIKYRGRYATVYYQHLYDTRVIKGQRVKAGQLIGLSGQTGNATGNHLHIAAMWGGNYNRYSRYAYMDSNPKNPPPDADSVCIWPVNSVWGLSDFVSFRNLGMGKHNNDVLQTQKVLKAVIGLDYSSSPGTWGPRTEAAWVEAGIRSKLPDSIQRLAWLGAKAPRSIGITAIP